MDGFGRRFAGSRILVTGAAGLIGRATAHRLAMEGADLIVCDISERRLAAVKADLLAAVPGCTVEPVRANILLQDDTEALVEAAGRFGPIDGLVNLVGGLRGTTLYARLAEIDEERWNGTFELNLKGIYRLVRAFGPQMHARGRGVIINTASVAYDGDPDQPEYSAAKAAIVSLTRSFAKDFAPHVRVNCVAPGFVTDLPPVEIDAVFRQKYVDRSLLGRAGQPGEIAAAIAFLASDDASFITGTTLPVAGGIWPSL